MKKLSFLIGSLGGGGAERVTVALGDYFCRKGYKVYFIVFSRVNNNYEINSDIKLEYLPENTGDKKSIFLRIKELKRILKSQNPDYVFSLGLGYQYLLIGNLLNKYKFILSERNAPQYFYKWYEKYLSERNAPQYFYKWYEKYCVKYCYKKAYKVVFQTKEAQEYFGEKIYKKSKVVANPITNFLPEPFSGIRDKKIVAVSRLSQQKNIFMLFRAFKKVLERYPEYILEIYGKGEQKLELEEYAKKLKIYEKVFFKGQKSNVHNYIVNATMFVSSSDFEGMSNSMLEAMAIGLPVVCTDCPIGGAKMVIKNGVNGLLTPIKDEQKFAEAMIYLLENPKLAENMGRKASELRHELSPEKIAKQWEELLEL